MDARRTGAFIAELRNEKGWKQKDLAAILQVSDKAISRWETGKGFPDTTLLIPLSEALGVSVSDLLAGERIKTEIKDKKVDTLLVETLHEKRKVAWKAISYFILILGVTLILSREFVSGPNLLWVLGIAMLSISASLFLSMNLSMQRRHGLVLFLHAQALLWEFLPLGTILVSKSGPDKPLTTQTYSYFSLIPFGNANFTPFFTGIATILCLLLDVLVITCHKKNHGVTVQKIKNATLFCSVFTILFSVLPLFLYGTLYVNGASYAITMLLSASTMLQVFNAPHGND